jgi:hypothetical protein
MKRFVLLFLAAFSFAFAPALLRAQDAPPPPPPGADQGAPPPDDQGGGQDQASFQTFYDQLGNDGNGNWIQTDQYGYVYQPNVSDPNWAPYTQGNWAYSDEGWTWVSDEPWGWATYHYGRWANIDGIGWVWVPGTRWAPAWVSWRYGDGYVGWAPLPPDTLEDTDYGDGDYHFGDDVDVSFDIGPGCYNFIPYDDFGAPNCGSYIVDRNRNYDFIGRTRNVTNFNFNHSGGGRGAFGGVFAGGPSLATINAHSSRHVPNVRLTAAASPGQHGVNGSQLAVFAPRFNAATARQGKPASVSQTLSHPALNHGTSIQQPLAVNGHVRPKAPTAAEIQQASQVHASTTARIPGAGGTGTHTGSATTFHPEAANTGEPSATGEPVHHTTTEGTFHPQAANTGEPSATGEPVHHETEPHTTSEPSSTFHPQTETHTTEAPAVEHHTEAPPAEEHHTEAPPVEHHTESPAPQVQHSAPPPHVEQHSAPAPQPHSAPAPAPHPSGGGKPPPQGDNKNNNH